MGYVKHNAVIVTNWHHERLRAAHAQAKEIYKRAFADSTISEPERIVGDVIHSLANSQESFFIAPDGSKEGWDTSDRSDVARKEFLDWIISSENLSTYVEIDFGGDDNTEDITRSLSKDLGDEPEY